VASVIQQIELEPDKDFQVITVSFDPRDTPEIANQKQINYLAQMKRPFPPKAWRFLTGTARSSTDVADSVGFKFRAEGDQYIHPGAIMVLTPTGIVSRYMYGISYLPADVQMALQEAAMQQVRPTISQALSFCYVYDPESRRYVFNITRAVGVATLLAIGVFLIFVLLKGYRHGKSRSQ
jgi:protein SCO1/2